MSVDVVEGCLFLSKRDVEAFAQRLLMEAASMSGSSYKLFPMVPFSSAIVRYVFPCFTLDFVRMFGDGSLHPGMTFDVNKQAWVDI